MNLSSIPEHVALKVIRNHRPRILPPSNGRLSGQLDEAFMWSGTREGHQYWSDIHHRLMVLSGDRTSDRTKHALLP